MKPKTRYPQKQERRLYLRDNDHRDIILNDAYVNALWLKKDDKDELVWQRYPRLYNIMFMRDASGSTARTYYNVLDIDREFAHSIRWSNNSQTKGLIKLDDLMVLHSGTEPMYLSFNGLNWSKMSKEVSGLAYAKKYGNDNSFLIAWEGESGITQISFKKVHFEIDEETKDITMYEGYIDYRFPYTIYGFRYLCDTANGMLIITRHYSPNRYAIYELTDEGVLLCDSRESDYYYQMDASNTKGCRKGSFYAYAWHNSFRQGGSYCNNIVVSVSNNMTDWIPTTVFRRTNASGYSTPYFHLLQRNGYFYLYVVSDGNLFAWKSATGSEWIELNLLDYVDVKCVTSGSYVSPAFDTIRIVLKASAEIPNDNIPYVGITDLFDENYNWGFGQDSFNNLLMQDGAYAENDEEYLGLNGWISGVYCAVYFDNMIFTPSEHNLFLLSGSFDENNGIEYIMEGDYCVPDIGYTYPYWNPTIDYVIGDIVTYGGLWKCLTGNKNKPPTEGTYWIKYKKEIKDELHT